MAGGGVAKLLSDSLFHGFNLGREELDRLSAFGADQVVMAAPVELRFVAADAVVKLHCGCDTTLRKELQGAIDGGESDFGIQLLYLLMKLIDG